MASIDNHDPPSHEKASDSSANHYDAEKAYEKDGGVGTGDGVYHDGEQPSTSMQGGVHRNLKQRHIVSRRLGKGAGDGEVGG